MFILYILNDKCVKQLLRCVDAIDAIQTLEFLGVAMIGRVAGTGRRAILNQRKEGGRDYFKSSGKIETQSYTHTHTWLNVINAHTHTDKHTLKCGMTKQLITVSSAPLVQSTSPSHFHLLGTHTLSPQWKLVSGGQVALGQWSPSSELSPQSFSPSQAHRFWMHRPLAQVNSSAVQLASGCRQMEGNKVVSAVIVCVLSLSLFDHRPEEFASVIKWLA